ncbi:MAG: DsbA family protein [Candidatus Puniceispirillum sp.]
MRHQLFLCLVAGLMLLTSGGMTTARADLDPANRQAIRQEIETYIRKNPEILRDALVALAAREEAARQRAGIAQVRNDAGDPVLGNPDGAITVYEFSDYNCGYCKRMFAPVIALLANNSDVRMVIKEFPILSPSSLSAAKAGIAAQKQGKFEIFHKSLMTYRGQVTDDAITAAAKAADIDIDQMRRDMDSKDTTAIIARTRAAAAALCINGTPGFVIGDTIIPGAVDPAQLQAGIDALRAKGG